MTLTDNPTSRRILSVVEEELNRIVLDVHDGPVQTLFAALSVMTQLEHEIQTKAPESPTLLPKVHQVTSMIEASLKEIKSFLGTFRSPEFQRHPLYLVLESLVIQHEEWTGQRVDLTIQALPVEISLSTKIALYRILQEALSNCHRHAEVDHQRVKLWAEDDWICLQISDEGKGFEPPPMDGPQATERHEHIGLRGMRERVGLLGGYFDLQSAVGQGTKITVKVPAYA